MRLLPCSPAGLGGRTALPRCQDGRSASFAGLLPPTGRGLRPRRARDGRLGALPGPRRGPLREATC
eukprot:10282301-Lingulodinium_polyedra.AAC.1